jgi:hypothetical protein
LIINAIQFFFVKIIGNDSNLFIKNGKFTEKITKIKGFCSLFVLYAPECRGVTEESDNLDHFLLEELDKMRYIVSMFNLTKDNNTMTTINADYVHELTFFYNKDFVIADSYTVIEPALSLFKKDQSITHAELNKYMKDNKDFKLESIIVLPELTQ